MNNNLHILSVWGLLVAIVIMYVIYRFVTDRKKGIKRHPLYPLVSKSTDGTFPQANDYIGWVVYVILATGIFAFIYFAFKTIF